MKSTSKYQTITPRQARSEAYLKAMQQELSSHPSEATLKACPINHPKLLAYKAQLLGRGAKGAEFADWTEFLLHDFGPQETCLSLGSGVGRVEDYLVRIGFTGRFESIELNPVHVELSNDRQDHIAAVEGDLNFVTLEAEKYDFVLCHGVLHHLINLEHVLAEINKTLTADGLLLIYEYVGPDRWQYPLDQLRHLMELIPNVRLRNRPVWSVAGFESVRSGDLLALIETQFADACERSVSYGSVFHPLVHCANWNAVEARLDEIIALDRQFSETAQYPASYHMGLYRKSQTSAMPVEPWSDSELRKRLVPTIPLSGRLSLGWHRSLDRLRARIRLRTRLKAVVRRLKRE